MRWCRGRTGATTTTRPSARRRPGHARCNGCTEVWVYNPNAAQITINYDRPGGNSYPTEDGSFTVPANSAAVSPTATNLLTGSNGARFWSAGGQVFSPLSRHRLHAEQYQRPHDGLGCAAGADQPTDLRGARRLGAGLLEREPQRHLPRPGLRCRTGRRQTGPTASSRNVVFVTAVANTNIYLDTNGSGLTCTSGSPLPTVTGAEQQTTGATALTSYIYDEDADLPQLRTRQLRQQSYSRDDSVDGWAGNQTWTVIRRYWTEGGGETPAGATAGAIQINTTRRATLRLQELDGTNEAGRTHPALPQHLRGHLRPPELRALFLHRPGRQRPHRRAGFDRRHDLDHAQDLRGPWFQTMPAPNFPRSEVFNISPLHRQPRPTSASASWTTWRRATGGRWTTSTSTTPSAATST